MIKGLIQALSEGLVGFIVIAGLGSLFIKLIRAAELPAYGTAVKLE